jgi:hypothetical protein
MAQIFCGRCRDLLLFHDQVALHELALPLAAGNEQPAGKGETTAQITPLISGHPAELDRVYVSSCW